MEKMYQAVREFIAPYIYETDACKETMILGVRNETVIIKSVSLRFIRTSYLEKIGWEKVDMYESDEIVNMVQRRCINDRRQPALIADVVSVFNDEKHEYIDSEYTIFIQKKVMETGGFINLIALDLATLKTYVVNKRTI